MASKALLASTALLSLNLLSFTLVSSTYVLCPPPPPKSHKHPATCPKDTLKLGVRADLLNDLVHLVVGTPPKSPYYSLIEGLADVEAMACLCTAIKANVLGINLKCSSFLELAAELLWKGPKWLPMHLKLFCFSHYLFLSS